MHILQNGYTFQVTLFATFKWVWQIIALVNEFKVRDLGHISGYTYVQAQIMLIHSIHRLVVIHKFIPSASFELLMR